MTTARLIITLEPGEDILPTHEKIATDVDQAIRGLRALGEDGLPLTVIVRSFAGQLLGEAGEDHLLIELAIDPMLVTVMGYERAVLLELRRSLEGARHHGLPLLPLTIQITEFVIPASE